MENKTFSPRITHLSWGKIKVEGYSHTFKDIKIFPGGARKWDWNETGTKHVPGIQPEDVMELLGKKVEVVILSQGINSRLRVMTETLELLEENNIETYVQQTEEAVELYNILREDKAVGGLFHSTC